MRLTGQLAQRVVRPRQRGAEQPDDVAYVSLARYHYGVALAGAALERIRGEAWQEIVERQIREATERGRQMSLDGAVAFYTRAKVVTSRWPHVDHAEEGDDFHKGVLLIYKQLFDILKKAGLRPIEDQDVVFDPNLHEAVIREENPSVPNQTVVGILQKGYFLHDRLIRPALVKVAVGGPERGDVVQ